MKLTKVNIRSKEDPITRTGGAHFHVFTNDETGEEVVERTTAAQHYLMKEVGGERYNPVKPGHTWVYTYGCPEYDTPTGELEEGQFAVDGDTAICRFPGTGKYQSFPTDAINKATGDVPKQAIDRINRDLGTKLIWQ